MTTTSITSGQQHQIVQFTEDAARRAAMDALAEIGPDIDKDGGQRVIERGDDLHAVIKAATLQALRDLSVSDRYADQEVESSYGYPEGYQRPKAFTDQVDILRACWKQLNPDSAVKYAREVYPTLQLPTWVEGPMALIRPGFFSNVYAEEVEEILKAIAASRQFLNYRQGQLTPKRFRQLERTARLIAQLAASQPGDLIVAPWQFGLHHRGRSVLRAREVFLGKEFGAGSRDTGTALITHPERLVRWEQLHVDCSGDEFTPDADGQFRKASCFHFYGRKVGFGAVGVGSAGERCGSASVILPQ